MTSTRVEDEFMELMSTNSWTSLYQKITRKSQSYSYTCNEAKKMENRQLNRYRDVNPYDHSRILLTTGSKDYINANLVIVEQANRQYILTQGPLAITAPDFWLMVWQQNTRGIVMLNKIVEKKEVKCYFYWPSGEGPSHAVTFGPIYIELTSEKEYKYFTIRTFEVTHNSTDETRIVTHFHYTTWPDFGVPSSPGAFLEFLKLVREAGVLENNVGPAVIHCSAGIGRSGTFCLVDSALLLIEREGQENVDIEKILLEMRKYRMGLIQTAEQFRFSYRAIIEGIMSLKPDYKPSTPEGLYEEVPREESPPPPPPPRGHSLSRPPARPLPAIPVSTSLGDLDLESTETKPETKTVDKTAQNNSEGTSLSSCLSTGEEYLRHRRNQEELAEKISNMKKRSRNADRWHAFKRSLYHPITLSALSVGFVAGIFALAFARR